MKLRFDILRLWQFLKGEAVPQATKLNKDASTALIMHSCFQLGASMSGLFLNLYLWRLTEDLKVNAAFNLILFLVTPIAFAIGGWITKKKDRMLTYRLGIMMISVFYLFVILAQEQVPQYFIWFAIFNGFAVGFYWTGYLVLQYDVTTDANRIRFLAINMVMFNTAGLAGPALAGFIIHLNNGLNGYIIIFTIAFIMFVIAAMISFRIPMIVNHHKAYYLKLMGLLMHKNHRWLKGLFSLFVFGLFQGAMLFLPNILLFHAIGREDWVGYLGVCFSALTVAMGFVISRKAQKEHMKKYIVLATSVVILGTSLLLFGIKLWSVIIFMALFSLSNPLTINTLTSYYYRLIGTLPLKGQLRVEAVVMREFFLNGGRALSLLIFVLFTIDIDSWLIPVLLFVTACIQLVILFLVSEQKEA